MIRKRGKRLGVDVRRRKRNRNIEEEDRQEREWK